MDIYSRWLEAAFPQPIQRQRYFKGLIAGKVISAANFRLAHLLSKKCLTRLVVTPNFDDFLSRALSLFGVPHIICDHPNTVERIDPESEDIQIVHVHGTYWFYDCCNLTGEIEARTEDTRDRSATMTSLLDNILSRRSALVIGYAGWEGDVIMNAIKRRLKGRLPYNLYWFCYKQAERDHLRCVLNNHRDVCLVLPPSAPAPAPDKRLAGSSLGATPGGVSPADTGGPPEPVLDACSVLNKMVPAFATEAPILTRDPIKFFALQLKESFPPPDAEDIYYLNQVLNRVDRAAQLLQDAETKERDTNTLDSKIEHVRDAVRRSVAKEAIEEALQLEHQIKTPEDRETLMELAYAAAKGIRDNSEAEGSAFDLVIRLAGNDQTLRLESRVVLANSMVGKGMLLRDQNRPNDAVLIFQEVVRRFGDSTETSLRAPLAKALVNLGFTLGQLNRVQEVVVACDDLLSRFDTDVDPEVERSVGWALNNKAVALGELQQPDATIQVCDALLKRFGDKSDPMLRELVARAFINKAFALTQRNRLKDAAETYQEVVTRYAEVREPVFREAVARSLIGRASALGQLGQAEDVVSVCDDLLQRFRDATEPAILVTTAWALNYKGYALGRLGKEQAALDSYDQAIHRFGNSEDPAFREPIAMTICNKGFELMDLGSRSEAEQAFHEVMKRLAGSSEPALQYIVDCARSGLQGAPSSAANPLIAPADSPSSPSSTP